jgi:holo-[acyl-carrier protein] synthase
LILGIGIDIVEVERIRQACERFGERFLQRILRPDEIEYCRSHRVVAPHVAARFAAKEAISKAFGTGLGRELGWLDIEVRREASGQPYVAMHDAGAKLLSDRGGRKIHLSLSHTELEAIAIALIED